MKWLGVNGTEDVRVAGMTEGSDLAGTFLAMSVAAAAAAAEVVLPVRRMLNCCCSRQPSNLFRKGVSVYVCGWGGRGRGRGTACVCVCTRVRVHSTCAYICACVYVCVWGGGGEGVHVQERLAEN